MENSMHQALSNTILTLAAITFGSLSLANEQYLPLNDEEPAQAACSPKAAYVFPNVTVAPFAKVVVSSGEQFEVTKTNNGLKIVHVGDATSVFFPSLVAVGQ